MLKPGSALKSSAYTEVPSDELFAGTLDHPFSVETALITGSSIEPVRRTPRFSPPCGILWDVYPKRIVISPGKQKRLPRQRRSRPGPEANGRLENSVRVRGLCCNPPLRRDDQAPQAGVSPCAAHTRLRAARHPRTSRLDHPSRRMTHRHPCFYGIAQLENTVYSTISPRTCRFAAKYFTFQ